MTNLDNEIKDALKAKNKVKVSTLRMLKAEIQNAEIDNKGELLDTEKYGIVRKELKKRQETKSSLTNANRPDLVLTLDKEIEILNLFLPQQWPTETLLEVVTNVIHDLGATSKKDMGNVVKAVLAKANGAASGKSVSEVVSQLLK